MCKCLKISKLGYYSYQEKGSKVDRHSNMMVNIFNQNHRVYGTRKIKKELMKSVIQLSRRSSKIMHFNSFISAYTIQKYKPQKTKVSEAEITNEIKQEFNGRKQKEVIVSDLTYVRVGSQWHYFCIIIDLFNREIVVHSCGIYKDTKLVYREFSRIKRSICLLVQQ